MLGILPREDYVKELPDGSYEAKVLLVKQSDGTVVGGASSLCGVDEQRWGKADKYARRSMAITRATGKAYRLCFSWVMSLAGYSPTPFEEMPEDLGGDDSLYTASPKQKIAFAQLCKELGVNERSAIKDLSDKFQGKVRLGDIRDALSQATAQ